MNFFLYFWTAIFYLVRLLMRLILIIIIKNITQKFNTQLLSWIIYLNMMTGVQAKNCKKKIIRNFLDLFRGICVFSYSPWLSNPFFTFLHLNIYLEEKRFYIRGTLRSIRIPRLAKITTLFRDWPISLYRKE